MGYLIFYGQQAVEVGRLPIQRQRVQAQVEWAAGVEFLAFGAAQCAASNRPLPGAETALILYHRYFPGKSPDRRATETGLFVGSSNTDAAFAQRAVQEGLPPALRGCCLPNPRWCEPNTIISE